MRAVVDTNVWVSGLFAPGAHSARFAHYLQFSAFQPVFCDETLLELKDAVTAPVRVARFGLPLVELNNLIRLLTSRGLELPNPEAIARFVAIRTTISSSLSRLPLSRTTS